MTGLARLSSSQYCGILSRNISGGCSFYWCRSMLWPWNILFVDTSIAKYVYNVLCIVPSVSGLYILLPEAQRVAKTDPVC